MSNPINTLNIDGLVTRLPQIVSRCGGYWCLHSTNGTLFVPTPSEARVVALKLIILGLGVLLAVWLASHCSAEPQTPVETKP